MIHQLVLLLLLLLLLPGSIRQAREGGKSLSRSVVISNVGMWGKRKERRGKGKKEEEGIEGEIQRGKVEDVEGRKRKRRRW